MHSGWPSLLSQREKMREWVDGVVDGDVAADAQRGQAARVLESVA